jgi:hypothetical protein
VAADLSNPIINSPYDPPEAYFEIGPARADRESAARTQAK